VESGLREGRGGRGGKREGGEGGVSEYEIKLDKGKRGEKEK